MALITALGILATLVLLALAFTLAARTERTISRNVLQRAMARHYADVALNHAAHQTALFQTTSLGAYDFEELFENYLVGFPAEAAPDKPLRSPHCFGSFNDDLSGLSSVRLGRPSVTNWLPQAVWDEATNTWSIWQPIISTNRLGDSTSLTNGRFAYLVVDCSGFLDVHGATSNHAAVLAAAGSDFDAGIDFSLLRDENGTNRYHFLSQPDLNARGAAWGFQTPASNLVACLFDPGPDVTVTNWSDLGENSIGLVGKFNLCPWDDAGLDAHPSCLDLSAKGTPLADWLDVVTNRLAICGYEGDEGLAVAWNLLNFIDRDRIPQAWDSAGEPLDGAWRNAWPVENVPLVNEFVVIEERSETNTVDAIGTWNGPSEETAENRRVLSPEGWTNHFYRVATELWYPFAPQGVEAEDDAGLTVGIYTNAGFFPAVGDFDDETLLAPPDVGGGSAGLLFGGETDPGKDALRSLEFDPADEASCFQVFTNPVPGNAGIGFPVWAAVTNSWEHTVETAEGPVTLPAQAYERVRIFLPLGSGTYPRYIDATTPPVETPYNNTLRPLARVSFGDSSYTNWVDEAPGYGNLPVFDGEAGHRILAIDDPRHNGDSAFWKWEDEDEDGTSDTLGATNRICTAWTAETHYGQGLPLIHFNGRLRSAGDIGHVASTGIWQSVCLADTRLVQCPEAAAAAVFVRGNVLDFFTTASTNRPVYGMMSYGTPWTNVIRAVMADIPVSESRGSTNLVPAIGTENGADLVDWMTDSFLDAREQDVTIDGEEQTIYPTTCGELAYVLGKSDRFREGPSGYGGLDDDELWRPATNRLDDLLKEDFIRGLSERVSFRQRLYVVVLGAQALAPNGRVASDQRAVATIAADLFTGRWRILNWAWLTE
ncbi:MAG: hypothetical protein ACOX5G_09245 [Kiritimatiellia bacterium]|jgi:hypothetical protein